MLETIALQPEVLNSDKEREEEENREEEAERKSDTKASSINKMNTSSLEIKRAKKARFNSLSDEGQSDLFSHTDLFRWLFASAILSWLCADVQHSLELTSRPTLDEPCSETQSRVTRSVLRPKQTAYELNDNDDNNDNKDDKNDQVS